MKEGPGALLSPRTKSEVRSGALLSSGPHRPPARLGERFESLYRRRPAVPTTSWPTPRAGRGQWLVTPHHEPHSEGADSAV